MKIRVLELVAVVFLFGAASGCLHHTEKATQFPTTPIELLKDCGIIGNHDKEIWLYTASPLTDHAIFASLDHKYVIKFASTTPFKDKVEFDKNTSPVSAVLKDSVRATCDSCPHGQDCAQCKFPFTIFNEDTATSCPDPGVHITR